MKTRYLSIIVGLLVLVLAGCQQPAGDFAPTFVPPTFAPAPTLHPSAVMTHTVAYGDVVDTLETRGRVEAMREAFLAFPLNGALKGLYIAPGDQVAQGALLAELSAPSVESEVLARHYALDMATLNLARANVISATQVADAEAAVSAAHARYQQVVLQGEHAIANSQLVTARCWESARNELDNQQCQVYLPQAQASAEAATAVAQAQLTAARRALDLTRSLQVLDVSVAQMQVTQAENLYLQAVQQVTNTQLTAPFSGVILSVEKRAGDSVAPYETLGVLSDPSQLWAIATVFEQDIHRVAVGQRVSLVLDAFLDETYVGSVLQIASQAVLWQGKWAYEVTIVFDDEQAIPAIMSMGADISFVVRAREAVLVIPTQAILVSGGREYVELWGDDGALQPVEIQTGISNGIETEVIAGLEAGQVVRIP